MTREFIPIEMSDYRRFKTLKAKYCLSRGVEEITDGLFLEIMINELEFKKW